MIIVVCILWNKSWKLGNVLLRIRVTDQIGYGSSEVRNIELDVKSPYSDENICAETLILFSAIYNIIVIYNIVLFLST